LEQESKTKAALRQELQEKDAELQDKDSVIDEKDAVIKKMG
jgi:hypothetical protein